ncbi:DUF192 domain-containing protein [Gramella sp. GC03-9]|uniref:DUF192 domain-containing protein n=1 Tax=Christiangramia oceanisediminis TaxID=2920386 RepID=A0A9X2REM5_9FLAO|nr:DUF192 domain-containing protein [Gramella oceanisediminis]MCP9201446.1 DUF192 domain-containing protein [Gramella oceanisediminis]
MKCGYLSLISLAFFTGSLFTSCEDEKKPDEIETEEISFTKEAELYLIKASGDTIEKLDVELAETAYEHQTGLMYRDGMEDNQGMLFVYDDERVRSFYMKNTYFSLDIIYFAGDSTYVSVQENTTPMSETSLPSEGPTQFVLEVNGGLSAPWNLAEGDRISFTRLD